MPVSHEWIYRCVAADSPSREALQALSPRAQALSKGSEQQALGDSQSALYRESARRGRDPQAVRGLES